MNKEAIIYYGMDLGSDVDKTAYYLYHNKQYTEITEQEYLELINERECLYSGKEHRQNHSTE